MSVPSALKSTLKPALYSTIRRLRKLQGLIAERESVRRAFKSSYPGHFYSPIPSLKDIRRDERKIFGNMPESIPGMDLRDAAQMDLLQEFTKYYADMPFSPNKTEGLRYYYDNPAYSYSDAIMLHCMIRHLKPKKIIEVGSGFSSCVIMDTNERFFDKSIDVTFIEPYPELLISLMTEDDRTRMAIVPRRLQDVELDRFARLEENDILFIDSSHVSKINSDVNRIFFDILPSLAAGVRVHFHDIFWPFEYPMDWIYKGIAWNETYMLHAFLLYNQKFTIELMNTYMEHVHRPFFEKNMPLCLLNPGGSIWLRAG
jgi:methyltransferase family protein